MLGMGNSNLDNKLYILIFCLIAGGVFAFMGAEKGRNRAAERYAQELDEDGFEDSSKHGFFSSRHKNKSQKGNKPSVPTASFSYISNNSMNPHDNNYEIGSSSQNPKHPAGQITPKQKNKAKPAKKFAIAKNSDGSSRFKKGSSSLNTSGGTSSAPVGGAPVANKAPQQKKQEENLDSLEFWIDPIFNKVEMAAVMKLVDSYQIKRVSPGVFYSLVDDMNHDERAELREFGVYALSSTPSAKSFSMLAWIKQNDTAADIRTSAYQQVASYTDVSRLGYIVGALKANGGTTTDSSAVNTSIEAMKIVQTATQKYASVGQLDNSKKSNTASLQAINKITQAADVINTSQLKSSNASVKAEAQKTIATVHQYINL